MVKDKFIEFVRSEDKTKLPTLAEFMANPKVHNAYLNEPRWNFLYIRKGKRVLDGQIHENVIELANIEAEVTGKGTFKKLVARIQEDYPEHTTFVENVLVPRFAEGLLRMGFKKKLDDVAAPCFWLAPICGMFYVLWTHPVSGLPRWSVVGPMKKDIREFIIRVSEQYGPPVADFVVLPATADVAEEILR